ELDFYVFLSLVLCGFGYMIQGVTSVCLWISCSTCFSALERLRPRLCLTRVAVAQNSSQRYLPRCDAVPQEKSGMKSVSNSGPQRFDPMPITKPVLRVVLIPNLA